MTNTTTSFFEALAESEKLKTYPYLTVLGLCTAAEFVQWEPLGVPTVVLNLLWIPQFCVLLAASYLAVCRQLKLNKTFAGGVRFAVTLLVQQSLPAIIVLLTIGISIILPSEALGRFGTILAVLLVGGGLVMAALLLSWPVAQSLSSSFVSPLHILKKTKGYRLPLVLFGCAISSFGGAMFSIGDADNWETALLYAAGGGVIWTALFYFYAVGTATAWSLMNGPRAATARNSPQAV